MAARPSALRERIEAALRPGPPAGRQRPGSAAFGGLSLSALALFAPGVHTADSADPAATPATAGAPGGPLAAASTASLRDAAVMLEAEYEALRRQALQVRAGLAGRTPAQELEPLLATLSQRLLVVERLRTHLRELLDRRDARNR